MDIAHFIFINIGLGDFEAFPLYEHNVLQFTKQNPNIIVQVWSEEDLDVLVKTEYNHLLEVWNSFPSPFYKIDFGRYLILKKEGGIYIDLDMECIAPLEPNQDYVNTYINEKGVEAYNNNIIMFRDKTVYDKIIEFSLYRLKTNRMPLSWTKRRFLYTVGARMYHKFCKDNGIEKTDVGQYFKDHQTKSWLKVDV